MPLNNHKQGESNIDNNDKRTEKLLLMAWLFVGYVMQRFFVDRCLRMAAGLSYTSLLAVVPLSAIAFSMLAAFPVFEGMREQFQKAVFANLLPQSAEAMQSYLDQFVQNTTSLSAVGIIALAATAILLLGAIEADMNAIFKVRRPRRLVPRLLVFWSMITLGPLLLGASFSLSTYFFAATEWMGVDLFSGPLGYLSKALPTLIFIVLMSLFYVAVPNRPVSIKSAVIGGVAAGLLFTVLRQIFGWYVATFPTYQNIYGALSVVPIFLVWMYLSWAVVLLGAVATSAMDEWKIAKGRPVLINNQSVPSLKNAITLLAIFYNVAANKGEISNNQLLKLSGLDEMTNNRILEKLISGKLVAVTVDENLVLCRDLSTVTFYDFYKLFRLVPVTKDEQKFSSDKMNKVCLQIQNAGIDAGSITMAELLKS